VITYNEMTKGEDLARACRGVRGVGGTVGTDKDRYPRERYVLRK
jgi:hypothetical protein